MRKTGFGILIVALLCTRAFPLGFGLEYSAFGNNVVGANLRINDAFEFKPQLGFTFSDAYNNLHLIFNGNYYFTETSGLQHYAGGALDLSVGDGNSDVGLIGHYGMRYDINDVISLFGEAGIDMRFDPFILSSFRGGAGITFYISRY
jgi:hypothetical protein